MKIRMTADSTCDLTPELIRKYNIGVVPLSVVIDGEVFHDGVDVTPRDIFRAAEAGKSVRTAAVNTYEYREFFREQLKQTGIGLICSMGDGEMERKSDIATAFDLQERIHEESGKTVKIAGTSYRAVSFDSFRRELDANGLEIIKEGFTDIQPDYWKMMFAVVKKKAY